MYFYQDVQLFFLVIDSHIAVGTSITRHQTAKLVSDQILMSVGNFDKTFFTFQNKSIQMLKCDATVLASHFERVATDLNLSSTSSPNRFVGLSCVALRTKLIDHLATFFMTEARKESAEKENGCDTHVSSFAFRKLSMVLICS